MQFTAFEIDFNLDSISWMSGYRGVLSPEESSFNADRGPLNFYARDLISYFVRYTAEPEGPSVCGVNYSFIICFPYCTRLRCNLKYSISNYFPFTFIAILKSFGSPECIALKTLIRKRSKEKNTRYLFEICKKND